jgi:hypothetical protein
MKSLITLGSGAWHARLVTQVAKDFTNKLVFVLAGPFQSSLCLRVSPGAQLKGTLLALPTTIG